MQIEFVGAAQTVTGSKHIVRTKRACVLLDCGLFQGQRRESIERNQNLGIPISQIDAVVLSHAHIDHSGALPILVKNGYKGSIYATPATRDLCAAMLADAASIQVSDAEHINKAIARDHAPMDPVVPLFDENDVARALGQMISIPYHRKQSIADGISLTFLDAGHVLGSAICVLDIDDDGIQKRLVFTGDLGRRAMPILRDPEVPSGATHLITETTYGDRLHPPIREMRDALGAALKRAYDRGGKVIIPSFALERTQELLYALKELKLEGRLPPIPVYLDSPLAIKITDVFKLHPECFDAATRNLMRETSPFDLDQLQYCASTEDSKAITAKSESSVVIAGGGMCEGGRVLHHLKASIESDKNMIIIVGFQAQHTLGRRIVEGRDRVRIFGVERNLRAEVVVLNGFSAHADQNDLLDFAKQVRANGSLQRVFLVHGDPKPQQIFARILAENGFAHVDAPAPGTRITM